LHCAPFCEQLKKKNPLVFKNIYKESTLEKKKYGLGLSLVLSLFSIINAAPLSGICVGLQITEEWTPGNLVVVEIPSLEKKVLVEGDCMGPCFSPVDAEYIAFEMNNTIWTIKSDGSQTEPENTGIPVQFFLDKNNILVNMEGGALYWLNLDNEMGEGEYFYWVSSYSLTGMQRCKVGTTQVEGLVGGMQMLWGGFSQDGRRASVCGLEPDWIFVYSVDLTKGALSTEYWRGCNSSVSPDGKYILHNMAPNPEWGTECDGESWCSMVRKWETGEQVEILNFACNNDMQHWSHFDTAVILSQNFSKWGKTCPEDLQDPSGLIYNIVTKELIDVGQCVPFDFFPGKIGEFEDRVAEPVFSPAGGILADGKEDVKITTATADASIRYTVDKSAPTQSHGTAIESGGSIDVSVSPGDPVTLKAIAYKNGMTESIVSVAVYEAVDTSSWITITSPDEGDGYKIGDTCRIRWVNSEDMDAAGMQIHVSFDDGISFYPVNGDSLVSKSNARWQDYGWIIPEVLDEQSTAGTEVRIRIKPYGNQYPNDVTGAFTIDGTGKAINPLAVMNGSTGLSLKRTGRSSVIFSSRSGQLSSIKIFDCSGRCIAELHSASTLGSKFLVWNCGKRPLSGGWYLAMGEGRDFRSSMAFVIR
jgi:hypothetical protein